MEKITSALKRIGSGFIRLTGIDLFSFDPLIRLYCAGYGRRYGFQYRLGPEKLSLIKGDAMLVVPRTDWIYLDFLARSYDHYFDSMVSAARDGFRVLDFSRPGEQTYRRSGLTFTFTSLPEDDWAIDEYFYRYKVKPGDIVFDLGTYCGLSAYVLSRLVGPEGKVYCFEPDENNHDALLANIARHGLKNVTVLKKGVWSESKTLEFFSEGTMGSSVKAVGWQRSGRVPVSTIEVVSLADACRELGIDHPDFVKMDVEGAEYEVIRGARGFIGGKNINFAMEVHPRNSAAASFGELTDMFGRAGFRTEVRRIATVKKNGAGLDYLYAWPGPEGK